MQADFEDDADFSDATTEAARELETIARYQTAAAKGTSGATSPLDALGLWGVTPEADLAAARDAFARGDTAGAATAADEATSSWASAGSIGQGRAMSLVALVGAALLTILLVVLFIHGRRRRRHRMHAHRIER